MFLHDRRERLRIAGMALLNVPAQTPPVVKIILKAPKPLDIDLGLRERLQSRSLPRHRIPEMRQLVHPREATLDEQLARAELMKLSSDVHRHVRIGPVTGLHPLLPLGLLSRHIILNGDPENIFVDWLKYQFF